MFGFWQSKTGNFLATNQNYLGFSVLFWDFAKLLSFPLPKNCTFFKHFLSQWKPQNCCWNWTFPTENFWYYKKKKKKKRHFQQKECSDWTISSSSINTSLGGTTTSSLSPSLPRWLFFHPWDPRAVTRVLTTPQPTFMALLGTNRSQVVVSSAFPIKYQYQLLPWILGYAAKDKKYPESRFSRSCLDHTAHIWFCDSGRWKVFSKIPKCYLPTV